MKTTVLFVTGLCLIAAGCHKAKPVAQGTQQIPAPVATPTAAPPPQQAKAAPAKQAPAQQTAVQPPAAAPKKLTPQQRTELNALLAKLADAFFDYNQTTIRADASTAMAANVTAIRNILTEYPTEKLLIEGHADERGSSEYNLALADKRSRAAQEFLSTRGIPQTQLSVLSYGEERPACKEQTEACFQQNRRIHITVAP
ncbi:MAG: OmpA family protein [Bryobacteraceae bacterium]